MAGTRARLATLVLGLSCLGFASAPPARQASPAAQTPAPAAATALTDQDMERFLREARIIKTRTARNGITNSTQATLSDGTLTHDAHIQIIDEFKREFRTASGVEFDFQDSWTFNIAAYKLDRLLGLHMVPVSVPGTYRSTRAAFTWWVDDVIMDEGARLKAKTTAPPEKARLWYEQVYLMRIFDQLIYNTDRNVGNMLIDREWRLWLIDHTRAFRKHHTLKSADSVRRCDRRVFEALKTLNLDLLKRELGRFLNDAQLKALLARRDLIVARLDSLGPTALFDRRGRATSN